MFAILSALCLSPALGNPSLREALAAAQAGDAKAQYIVGMMYIFGQGTPQDVPRAVQWPERSADAKMPQALLRSPDYDQAARGQDGGSGYASPMQDNRCADNGGHMEGTQCLDGGRVPIDPSNGQHYR